MAEEFGTPITPEAPQAKKTNTPLIIAIVAVVVLCCCCATGSFAWWMWNTGGDMLLEMIEESGSLLPLLLS